MQAAPQSIDILEFLAREAFLQVSDNAPGSIDTDIGHNEFCFELVEHVLVDLAARCKIGEVIGEPAVAPVQACAQFSEKALACLGTVLVLAFCKHRCLLPPAGGEWPTLSG